MEAVEYEEGYFKLKKSNEELVTLLNKVINDLKVLKTAHKSEKDKNAALSATNGNISAELIEVTRKCEDQSKTITDLNEKLDYLQSYSKAVEGVAENYCGKSITTQKKYDQLKRQSSIFFSNLPNMVDFDIVDNEYDSDILDTPVPILEIEEIKTTHEEIINKEKEKYENLRKDFIGSKNEIIRMKNEIEKLLETIQDKDMNVTQLNGDLDIVVASYKKLQDDHEKIMNYFEPYLRIKVENDSLKRTSALLLNNVAGDENIMEFLKVIDNLKTEILDKDNKISNLEVKLLDNDQSTVTLELAAVRTELEELTGKLENLIKERDTLKHENRILLEQKGGYGICLPPPPPPPPPPQPSKIMKIFKHKKKKGSTSTSHSPTEKSQKDVIICNLMEELEKKLLEKVKKKQIEKFPTSPSEKNIDDTDSKQNQFTVNLRKQSCPTFTTDQNKKKNELEEIFEKQKEKKAGHSPFLKKQFVSIDNSLSSEKKAGHSPFLKKQFVSIDNPSSVNQRKKSEPIIDLNKNKAKIGELGEVTKKIREKKNPRISEEKNDGAQDNQQNISENENKSNRQPKAN